MTDWFINDAGHWATVLLSLMVLRQGIAAGIPKDLV